MYPANYQVNTALHENTLGNNEHYDDGILCDIEFVFKQAEKKVTENGACRDSY